MPSGAGEALHGVVVVIDEIHGVLVDPAEQLGGDGIELDLGVSGSGKRHITAVYLTKASLGIDERMEKRFISACQTHHRFVDRHITVRI